MRCVMCDLTCEVLYDVWMCDVMRDARYVMCVIRNVCW